MATCDDLLTLNGASKILHEQGIDKLNSLLSSCGAVRKARKTVASEDDTWSQMLDEYGEKLDELEVKLRLLLQVIGATVWRSASGQREGVIVTSNGWMDREHEHVATEALNQYVRGCYDDAGSWKGNNRLLFHHDIDIGEVVAAGVIEGFLVEIVRERPGIIPEIIWDYWQDTGTNGSVQWGASHGFKATREGNTYVRIDKYETTVLDVADAANLATYSGVMKMSNQSKHLDAAFAKRGIQNASKLIAEQGIHALLKALRTGAVAGRQSKAAGDTAELDAVRDEIEGLNRRLLDATPDYDKLVEIRDVLRDALAVLEAEESTDDDTNTDTEADKRLSRQPAGTLESMFAGFMKPAVARKSVKDGMDPMFPGWGIPLKK